MPQRMLGHLIGPQFELERNIHKIRCLCRQFDGHSVRNIVQSLAAIPGLKLYLTVDKDLVQAVLGSEEGKGALDQEAALC